MLSTSASLVLGFTFVLVGGVNVWLVLEAWSRVKATNASSRMLTLHRIGGYLFIALFCVMTYFMVARLRSGGADTSATVTIHLALAMILSPLLFIKVLIARYYKNQHGLLMPIGLTIFVLAFVLIASTAGPYLARATRIEQVSIDPAHTPPVTVDVNQASDLMQRRCSKCHNLDRVVGARKDAQGWITTVNRMRALTGAGISDAEARTIISYLASQNQPRRSEATVKMEVARALVDQRCGRCHSLDRVYKAMETPAQWREIVTRMVGYAAGSTGALQPGEDQRIIDFLSTTQTPEAVAQRKAQADAAAAAGQSLITQTAPAMPASVEPSAYDGKMIGFVSLVCLAGVVLVVRRPRVRVLSPAKVALPAKVPAAMTPRVPNNPFILQLVQVTKQTPDSTSLRFVVNGDRKFDARPGQFLTFSFLFDGKKETRCYSICSSPARSGYVEITPKRVKDGCVSVFLNDRAPIGMTVEATGPFGQFCLMPEDQKIVLVAAGSGITPMMAMLRYLDDLCLDTQATLLYCVRTRDDIIFRQEFEELRGRLKNFQYHVLLSKPDADWPGARGHISRDFISKKVPDLDGRVFFLCGPPPFMEAARRIFTDLGVPPERIRQETFGGAGAGPKPALSRTAETGLTIEFATSGKTASVLEGQSLLEAAAEAGVEIPSACRQGQCGTCKTRLLAGDVHMTTEQGLDPESRARGFVLTCVGHANSDVRLDV
ncbi:MAG TPA: photosystem P840 reaction-center cytochrome c-551 [Bryobacteraceae bacterium]|nr:photosystem P840 reaction-center cytochrome c-551 [Bryobacteraceae bacterium]